MRLRLTFESQKTGTLLPINYQYPVSSFIYKTLARADSEFASWLHETGFDDGNKKFKFFTFSAFRLPEFKIEKNIFKLLGNSLELEISILSPKTLEKFIIGLFESQQMKLYGREYESCFNIKFIESIAELQFTDCMKFKTLSPVVLSARREYKGKLSEVYLNPGDEKYFQYLKANIKEKYSIYSEHFGQTLKWDDSFIQSIKFSESYRSKLITIKEGKQDETKVRGYLYEFEICGNPELMKFIYTVGVGKLASLGFGFVMVKE